MGRYCDGVLCWFEGFFEGVERKRGVNFLQFRGSQKHNGLPGGPRCNRHGRKKNLYGERSEPEENLCTPVGPCQSFWHFLQTVCCYMDFMAPWPLGSVSYIADI